MCNYTLVKLEIKPANALSLTCRSRQCATEKLQPYSSVKIVIRVANFFTSLPVCVARDVIHEMPYE